MIQRNQQRGWWKLNDYTFPKFSCQIPLGFGFVGLLEKLFGVGVFDGFAAGEKRRFVADAVNPELPDRKRLFIRSLCVFCERVASYYLVLNLSK